MSVLLTPRCSHGDAAAASVSARQSTNEDVGEFILTITPRPGHSLTNLEAAADAMAHDGVLPETLVILVEA